LREKREMWDLYEVYVRLLEEIDWDCGVKLKLNLMTNFEHGRILEPNQGAIISVYTSGTEWIFAFAIQDNMVA
jgi:hypothetical protein